MYPVVTHRTEKAARRARKSMAAEFGLRIDRPMELEWMQMRYPQLTSEMSITMWVIGVTDAWVDAILLTAERTLRHQASFTEARQLVASVMWRELTCGHLVANPTSQGKAARQAWESRCNAFLEALEESDSIEDAIGDLALWDSEHPAGVTMVVGR